MRPARRRDRPLSRRTGDGRARSRRPDPLRDLILLALLLLVALLLALPAAAREWRGWCGAPGAAADAGVSLGWHFYCDRDEETVEDRPRALPPTAASPPPESATARIAALRERLEEARAAAILDPSPAKVAAYLRLQQATLQRAAAFSDAFRRTVWASPDLDYTQRRPVGALAKQVWSDARRAERAAALARLSQRYGLIYLGHPDCAACRVAGPLLRAFATRYGLDVLAVSMNGAPLEGWPEAVPDRGRAARLGLDGMPVPAVALFDTGTKTVTPVGFGILAEDELAERLFVLTQRESGHDY